MYCKSCGQNLGERQVAFCPYCGDSQAPNEAMRVQVQEQKITEERAVQQTGTARSAFSLDMIPEITKRARRSKETRRSQWHYDRNLLIMHAHDATFEKVGEVIAKVGFDMLKVKIEAVQNDNSFILHCRVFGGYFIATLRMMGQEDNGLYHWEFKNVEWQDGGTVGLMMINTQLYLELCMIYIDPDATYKETVLTSVKSKSKLSLSDKISDAIFNKMAQSKNEKLSGDPGPKRLADRYTGII